MKAFIKNIAIIALLGISTLSGIQAQEMYKRSNGKAYHIDEKCPSLNGYEVVKVDTAEGLSPCRICNKKEFEQKYGSTEVTTTSTTSSDSSSMDSKSSSKVSSTQKKSSNKNTITNNYSKSTKVEESLDSSKINNGDITVTSLPSKNTKGNIKSIKRIGGN